MRTTVLKSTLAAMTLILGSSLQASAGQVTFSFDNQLAANGTTNVTGLASGAAMTGVGSIQTYMNNVLTGTGITVSSIGGGATTDQAYNGDGRVVGLASNKPVTLGDSDGASPTIRPNITCGVNTCTPTSGAALDSFVKNTGSTDGSFWSFVFSGAGLSITSVSFDYEIFPDGTCATISCGANLPDFTLTAGATQLFHIFGTTPPGTSHSPVSGAGSELTPQSIGNTSGLTGALGNVTIGGNTFLNTGGVTSLTFTDWPATIGIDNLTINYTTSAVPEPGSMLLLGTGLVGLYVRRKKRLAA